MSYVWLVRIIKWIDQYVLLLCAFTSILPITHSVIIHLSPIICATGFFPVMNKLHTLLAVDGNPFGSGTMCKFFNIGLSRSSFHGLAQN